MKVSCLRVACVALFACAAGVARADSADDALALARRTYAYVAKSVDAKTLKPYARELDSDAAWLASAAPPPSWAPLRRPLGGLPPPVLCADGVWSLRVFFSRATPSPWLFGGGLRSAPSR